MIDIWKSDAMQLVADFGEEVGYHPKGGTLRTITAIVDRMPPSRYDPNGNIYTASLEISCVNDATIGIAATDIVTGDTISVADNVGGSASDHMVNSDPVEQDAGMVKIAVR